MAEKKRTIRQAPIVSAFAERYGRVRAAQGVTQKDLAQGRGDADLHLALEGGGAAPASIFWPGWPKRSG